MNEMRKCCKQDKPTIKQQIEIECRIMVIKRIGREEKGRIWIAVMKISVVCSICMYVVYM